MSSSAIFWVKGHERRGNSPELVRSAFLEWNLFEKHIFPMCTWFYSWNGFDCRILQLWCTDTLPFPQKREMPSEEDISRVCQQHSKESALQLSMIVLPLSLLLSRDFFIRFWWGVHYPIRRNRDLLPTSLTYTITPPEIANEACCIRTIEILNILTWSITLTAKKECLISLRLNLMHCRHLVAQKAQISIRLAMLVSRKSRKCPFDSWAIPPESMR